MTAQPQPTAALSDAQLIRDVQATLDDMEAHDVALTAGNLIDALDYHGIHLAAAPPSGQVCVDRDDLELAIEWMDQTDNPWSGEAFQDTWAASLVARDQLKDALHESYVTEGVAR